MLTAIQLNAISAAFYRSANACGECMPLEIRTPVWISALGDAVVGAIEQAGIATDFARTDARALEYLILSLDLQCPTCGGVWVDAKQEVGQLQVHSPGTVLVSVPTLPETPRGYAALGRLWTDVPSYASSVTFTFDDCQFLRPTMIAFLGGVASTIKMRGGYVSFAWDTMTSPVKETLVDSGFGHSFGVAPFPLRTSVLPYRKDSRYNADSIIAYLRRRWLSGELIRMSPQLVDRIVGNVWEIYSNAFEYAGSDLEVFTCGQHFPVEKELTLTVLDLGRGIPANVSDFIGGELDPEEAMRWAFERGNTTNPAGIGRGLGLHLLHEFVAVNDGRLEVSSRSGYAEITKDGATFRRTDVPFPGTAVRISLRCDESFYHLVPRPTGGSFF